MVCCVIGLPSVMCNLLLFQIVTFSNVKEDVYGGLDAWCAWELEFPLVTIKKALKLLQEEKKMETSDSGFLFVCMI